MSKHTGEFLVNLGGQSYRLIYDWAALSRIQDEVSKDALIDLPAAKPSEIAKLLSIGLNRNHPEMTAEKLMELSPPIISVLGMIDAAIAYAYYGSDGMKPLEEGEKKKR